MSRTPSKPAIRSLTPEEDAKILAAAMADPDAQPLTDAQLAAMVPLRSLRGRARPGGPALDSSRTDNGPDANGGEGGILVLPDDDDLPPGAP